MERKKEKERKEKIRKKERERKPRSSKVRQKCVLSHSHVKQTTQKLNGKTQRKRPIEKKEEKIFKLQKRKKKTSDVTIVPRK